VFAADAWWAVAALIWLGTGLWRAFGHLEKPTAYYLAQPLFHAKLTLFVLIVLLEIAPMLALIKWRAAVKTGTLPDTRKARTYARIGYLQAGLVIAIVACAVGLARNY
jgi:putative membrane protein